MACESLNNDVELRKTSGKGEGVFATKRFDAGDVVMVGIIQEKLQSNNIHASQIGENDWILYAGLLNRVNHSCEPNCGIRANESGTHDLIAMKDVLVDDEIVYDYAMENYTIDHFSQQCSCGSIQCRNKITGWKDLTREKKQEYAGFVAPYLLELDAISGE